MNNDDFPLITRKAGIELARAKLGIPISIWTINTRDVERDRTKAGRGIRQQAGSFPPRRISGLGAQLNRGDDGRKGENHEDPH